jgi:hypothetical protein
MSAFECLCDDEAYAKFVEGMDTKLLPDIKDGTVEEWVASFCRAFPDMDQKVMTAWVYRIGSDYFDSGRG